MEGWQIEADGWGGILVLPQQVMVGEMLFREINKLLRCRRRGSLKDLAMNMAAEVLYSDLAESSFGRYCDESSAFRSFL
jgi:hypothetical protein